MNLIDMKRKIVMKRKSIFIIPVLALILAFSACTGVSPANGSEGDTNRNNRGQVEALTIAITRDVNTLTPITFQTGTPGFDTMRFMYDSLFTISPDNEVIPWMVDDSFTISDDYRVYEMTLLPGQKWHDGSELTGLDVKFTFYFFRDTEIHSRWTPIASKVESIEVEGDKITITLIDPDIGFLRSGLADMRIISKNAHEGVSNAAAVPNMGSGPYRLLEYVPGQFYTLEAVDSYFRGTPRVRTLRMPVMTDRAVIHQALAAGEIAAFTGSIGVELFDFFDARPEISIGQSDGFASYLLLMSNVTAPFDQRDFRRAVSMAIDVEFIMDTVFLGRATAGTAGYVREGLEEHVEGLPHIFDIDQSVKLLESLGYTEKNNNGIRLKTDGSPLEVELLVSSASIERIRMAEIISVQLNEVGIAVNIRPMDPDTLDEFVWPDIDTTNPHNYQMAMWGWSAPVVQRLNAIVQVCSSDFAGTGILNLSHFKNAEFDELADKMVRSVDRNERAQLNERLQRIVAEEVPFVTIGFEDNISAVNTAMYDGWVFAKGTNAVNIFSFLP